MAEIFNFSTFQTKKESREHHQSEVRPKKTRYTTFHERQNDRKGRFTPAHFCENYKKVK